MTNAASRILFTLALMLGGLSNTFAYNQTYNLNVGDQFTVYTSYHYYTNAVLWTYDWQVVEPVTYIGSASTSVTFKCIAPSPNAGSIIQAVTYYYQSNTTSSGINKDVDDWKVYVKDNSTVSLNKNSISLDPGSSEYLTATPSNSSYSGSYTWSSSNSNAAYISGSGSNVRVVAQNSGSTTITVKLDNGNSAQCSVTVRTIDVSSASVSPSTKSLDIDETASLSLSVSPSNATITSRSWKSKNSSVVSVSSSGAVTGVSEGSTEIYCIVNGSVTSSSCKVTVSKPSFTLSNSSPSNNATNQSVFIQPSLTFCRAIYKGTAFSNITLKDGAENNVEGAASTNGSTLTFAPSAPLNPNTSYTLSVPASAVKDKYGSANSAVTRTFTTGNLQKLTVSVSTTERFLSKGEKITLSSSGTNVSIYYTLDGSTPTEKSTKYQTAIVLNNDIKLRAIAMGAGYESSDMLSQDYYVTNVDIVKKFPDAETRLFEYKDVNPYITFSNGIVTSTNIGGVKVKKNGTEEVAGDVIVADNSIFFVPKQPLDLGCNYQVSIPGNAVKTWQGEENNETSWSFSTGNYVTNIAMGGPELAMAAKTDGTFQTWGMRYKSGNAADGSHTITSQLTPSSFMDNDFRSVSSGYMHHAIIKNDGSLWMWGRQYCGEFGNNSTTGSANPVKVMDDVSAVSCGGQTTAIITTDGSLWMCGRNDFGQIGDNSVVNRSEPVRIMSDVSSAAAGWCVTYAIKNDGSLWAWGYNDKYLLGNGVTDDSWSPIKVLDDVAVVATSATESKWAAAIKTDGTLWVWGETLPSPTKVLEEVSSVAVGADYVVAVRNDGSLWAWGENDYGQIGNETTVASNSPLKVMDDVSMVASGGQTTMVNMQNGSVWTWGRNNTGLLGDGSTPSLTAYNSKPVQVIEGRSSSPLTGIASRKKTYRIAEGSLNVIDAIPVPMNGVYQEITWTSQDNNIVSVQGRGVIKAESFGETDVVSTIKNDKGSEYTMTCHVIVTDATGINNVCNNNNGVIVWADKRMIHIDGLQIGQHIYVYGADGTLVYQGIANSATYTIPINSSGVYVVRVDRISEKVLVR
ncbi:MAG: Ig-like domain-containing protein [Prevotella sp.]|nr:Ig-like domain-containing protein [Prevotella sp.]